MAVALKNVRHFIDGVCVVVFCAEVCRVAFAGPISKTYAGGGHYAVAKPVRNL